MEPSDIYAACRGRLLALAPTLDAGRVAAPLAATPPWTVLDGYRHLAGVCSDVLDGLTDGAGSPAWTAAQLAGRAGCTLADVCAEWARRGPDMDARIAAAGRAMAFAAFDAWTHEQDIRAAVGLAGQRDEPAVPALASLAMATFAARYGASGAPAVEVAVDGTPYRLGGGEPDVSLRTSSYEILRIVFGRRSRRQVEAADWTGPRDPVVDALHLFDHPGRDIAD